MTSVLVSLDDVEAAARRLEGIAQRTPIERSRAASEVAGVEILLKCEHLQRTGSFKIRGAYNRIATLSEEERARGVVCASAGNHAQGVALSAALSGVKSTVFMPNGAPLPKVAATHSYGAEVVLVGDTFDDAHQAACAWGDERDATFVHPFDHPDVIAGQGTIGLEILDEVPDVGTAVVAVGGGGLISGVATALKLARPQVRVVGVQAAGAASFRASMAAGMPRPLDAMSTIADGIAVKTPGELTLAHVLERVDELCTVTDEAIARAVLLLVERAKQVVEPSGAAPLAAVLEGVATFTGPVVVLLGGGNVDPLLLLRILQSGMGEEGRYFAFRTKLVDQPGALSRLLALIAEHGANVVAVEHHRHGPRLSLLEVEVLLEVETRGPDHIRSLVDTLVQHRYEIG
jgi:threonine dehydratase